MEQFRLIVFEAVWNAGSYTKAARQLGITQPAVSQNIAELEKELGTALFTRASVSTTTAGDVSGDDGSEGGSAKGGKMTPTPAAKVFMWLVQRVLKGYDDIRVLFNPETGEYGKVRIRADRAAAEYVLPKILETLKATHPTVDFEVLAPDNTDDEVDVFITTVASRQQDAVVLRFEAFGPAAPFVEAVRLLLTDMLNL